MQITQSKNPKKTTTQLPTLDKRSQGVKNSVAIIETCTLPVPLVPTASCSYCKAAGKAQCSPICELRGAIPALGVEKIGQTRSAPIRAFDDIAVYLRIGETT